MKNENNKQETDAPASEWSDLLACPFCGADAFLEQVLFGEHGEFQFRIRCQGIEAHALDQWFDVAIDARGAWNTRTTS